MKNIIIESANGEDHEKLSRIAFEAKSHWGYPEDWMRMWEKDLLITENYIEDNYVYKLIFEKALVGFIALEEGTDCFHISHLWIRPEEIGKGFGYKLLNEVVTKVVKPGIKIIVESDPNAEEFYKRLGFETYDRKESTPKGRFLPLMRKIQR